LDKLHVALVRLKGPRAQGYPHSAAGAAAYERKDVLPMVAEDEISLTKGAAGQNLYRIRTACVGFNNGYQFFILGSVFFQPGHPGRGRFEAYGKAGAHVAVKIYGPFPALA
jgi:hypothetical protein